MVPAKEKIKAAGALSKAGADGDSSRGDRFIIQSGNMATSSKVLRNPIDGLVYFAPDILCTILYFFPAMRATLTQFL